MGPVLYPTYSRPVTDIVITDKQVRETGGFEYFVNYGYFYIAATPMTFHKGRIVIAEDFDFVDDGWCYDSMKSALSAMMVWNPLLEREPSGWFRNPTTGRRRENGDPEKETHRW